MTCRAQRKIKSPRSIVMKNGRLATQGVCPVCGAKLFRIRKGRSHPKATEPIGISGDMAFVF